MQNSRMTQQEAVAERQDPAASGAALLIFEQPLNERMALSCAGLLYNRRSPQREGQPVGQPRRGVQPHRHPGDHLRGDVRAEC